ncbi:unnamed protein product [Peronospora belbahrii]|uniref:Secreted protein n=1 Tax=Peronospora belbahrii TaxID=622444 RepID=A0AAU9L6B4_9STRA|nr:unnamed protein product [Peronospora belbahrii]
MRAIPKRRVESLFANMVLLYNHHHPCLTCLVTSIPAAATVVCRQRGIFFICFVINTTWKGLILIVLLLLRVTLRDGHAQRVGHRVFLHRHRAYLPASAVCSNYRRLEISIAMLVMPESCTAAQFESAVPT